MLQLEYRRQISSLSGIIFSGNLILYSAACAFFPEVYRHYTAEIVNTLLLSGFGLLLIIGLRRVVNIDCDAKTISEEKSIFNFFRSHTKLSDVENSALDIPFYIKENFFSGYRNRSSDLFIGKQDAKPRIRILKGVSTDVTMYWKKLMRFDVLKQIDPKPVLMLKSPRLRLLFKLGISLVVLGFSVFCVGTTILEVASLHWPHVNSDSIQYHVSSEYIRSSQRKRTEYYLSANYDYTVSGKQYHGTSFTLLSDELTYKSAEARDNAKDLYVSKGSLPIYYMPSKPELAILINESDSDSLKVNAALLLIILLTSLFNNEEQPAVSRRV